MTKCKGMVIEVRGQYSPYPGTDQVFQLVRLKISCCANDATQVNVDMVSREPIRNIKFSDWVQVTGRVDFRKDEKGSYKTVLYISKASDVVKCAPDADHVYSMMSRAERGEVRDAIARWQPGSDIFHFSVALSRLSAPP